MKLKIILSILVVIITTSPLYSQVQTIYVSTKGNDRFSGGEKRPLQSLNSAILKAQQFTDSVRIVLKPGEHRTTSSIVVKQGSWTSLEIVGEDGAKVSGDIVVKPSMIKSVKDRSIYDRLQPQVRDKIKVILKWLGTHTCTHAQTHKATTDTFRLSFTDKLPTHLHGVCERV